VLKEAKAAVTFVLIALALMMKKRQMRTRTQNYQIPSRPAGDVVYTEENFKKDIVPSLNTNKEESVASMDKIRHMIATYKAKFFINHDKKETDTLKLIPAFYD
jgi:hypothetical protein